MRQDAARCYIEACFRPHPMMERESWSGTRLKVAKDVLVSEEMANKFKTEKDTPYLRFVRGEGLTSSARNMFPISARSSSSWAASRRRRQGRVHNHEASRTSNDCYVCEMRRQEARAAASSLRGNDHDPRRPRLDHGLEQRGARVTFEWKAGSISPFRSTAGSHFNAPPRGCRLVGVHQLSPR